MTTHHARPGGPDTPRPGYIADESDQVGPLFGWYFNGDTALTEGGLLEDPDVVIRGDRVLHLRYRVRR